MASAPLDPIIPIAFAISASPGAYALLLGSGVSRAAGIPTGWEVVLDLVRKMAALSKENCEPDPAAWYHDHFGHDPDYANLLATLAKTPSARQQLLRGYFEPTETEREAGLKLPTAAHRAIARLVQTGDVRVVVTTNFDRLLEHALEEVGIVASVISTTDAIAGALPLAHAEPTIVKVHGDYCDTRIKNAPDELNSYSRKLVGLLDRIFDEFGLIVCGWSAEWDGALRSCLERRRSRRFPIYWSTYTGLSEATKQLASLLQAETVTGYDADRFFSQIEEKVSALKDIVHEHPLSTKTAVATLKRYLPNNRHRIRLEDLVRGECERAATRLSEAGVLSAQGPVPKGDSARTQFDRRIATMEASLAVVSPLLANGTYWDEGKFGRLWIDSIERIANLNQPEAGWPVWTEVGHYPALYLLYSAGLGCVAARRSGTLLAITQQSQYHEGRTRKSLFDIIEAANFLRLLAFAPRTAGAPRLVGSDHLHRALHDSLSDLIPDDRRFDEVFDIFEYALASLFVDRKPLEPPEQDRWMPVGRFAWGNRTVLAELASVLEDLLNAGAFGGSRQRMETIRASIERRTSRVQNEFSLRGVRDLFGE